MEGRIMKRTILIQLVIVCSVISSIAQTNYYEVTKTLVENSYTYQCDVSVAKMVTLYNKVNQYTYVDQKINATGELVPIGGMKEPFEDDNWTKSRCYEIVESAFSAEQASRMKGRGITIAMYISPSTGKVMEVNFQFTTFNPAATIPLSVYRKIETDLKANIWFVPTEFGKKLNYIMLWWRYNF
jgi:hypothetical protein